PSSPAKTGRRKSVPNVRALEPGEPLRGAGGDPARRNANDSLAVALGGEIIAGLYPPGSRLPSEAALLDRFKVSRPTLREAFRVLSAKGLIVSRQKVGTSVRPRSEWNMLDPDFLAWHLRASLTEGFVADLFQLRQMVEPQAAYLAARSSDPAAIERIRAAFLDMERWKNGRGDLIGADLRFHQSILDATGNPFIGALGGLIHTALIGTFQLGWRGVVIRDDRLHQHQAVLEAIEAGAKEAARERMAELLQDSIDDVRRALAKRGAGKSSRREIEPA
ncbi:MAG TPA: FadR/GntR family transcriptional regulator, partial [Roseiarcus sp.]|nr:FadR/GntR family transcriptional regulator [Roseiarcus sp.]